MFTKLFNQSTIVLTFFLQCSFFKHVGSTLNLSDETHHKPNGNSKRIKKRKVIESNDEINEVGQQTSGQKKLW